MKKILVTGGAGYIGSKLVTKLLNIGCEVTVVDVLKFSSKSLNHLFSDRNFHFIKGDVRNKKLMKKLVEKNELIIPLAASIFSIPIAKLLVFETITPILLWSLSIFSPISTIPESILRT